MNEENHSASIEDAAKARRKKMEQALLARAPTPIPAEDANTLMRRIDKLTRFLHDDEEMSSSSVGLSHSMASSSFALSSVAGADPILTLPPFIQPSISHANPTAHAFFWRSHPGHGTTANAANATTTKGISPQRTPRTPTHYPEYQVILNPPKALSMPTFSSSSMIVLTPTRNYLSKTAFHGSFQAAPYRVVRFSGDTSMAGVSAATRSSADDDDDDDDEQWNGSSRKEDISMMTTDDEQWTRSDEKEYWQDANGVLWEQA